MMHGWLPESHNISRRQDATVRKPAFWQNRHVRRTVIYGTLRHSRGRVLQDGGVQPPDPAAMRKQYRAHGLSENELAADPMRQFARWFAEVTAVGIDEPNAMVLSTADAEGVPSSRTVLLKSFDERGFVFFTNHTSRKGGELAVNPHASLLFPWHPIARQVVVAGDVTQITRDETDRYFHSRPYGSQLGAWTSRQSAVIDSREVLERRYEALAERHPEGEPVPVPPFWGGYRVTPRSVEFWQGRRNRLHDRLRYRRTPESATGWTVERLAP
jgi:pyridoxamine 5'-phosphate oxidase